MRISIVIPALDEAHGIVAALAPLQMLRADDCEVILVDGGSRDDTVMRAQPWCDKVVRAPRGRARQMNAGAAAAEGEVLLFLHADTLLPPGGPAAVRAACAKGALCWGRFDVVLAGKHPLLAVVGAMMNLRSRLSGIATGDQAMFMTRAAFDAAGGFPPIPLMEDVAISKKLKRLAAPACLMARVVSSGRRWESRGVLRTIFLMWRLRLAYFLGASPDWLARCYR